MYIKIKILKTFFKNSFSYCGDTYSNLQLQPSITIKNSKQILYNLKIIFFKLNTIYFRRFYKMFEYSYKEQRLLNLHLSATIY